MTVGRFTGDRLSMFISPANLVRYGGLTAAVGLGLVIAFPLTPVALFGFGLVGVGISITIPLAFSAAGNMPGIAPGIGIAGVATIGYSGFLAGPPVIGLISEATSLRFGLGFVAVLVATQIFTSQSIRQAETSEEVLFAAK